ncbi:MULTISPECIES: HlyD family type I secretion periplasmic adaptor subunit [unclassified Nitrobacter]|uniref:HlyD family type I secretion periplasmic adaptor subunit n=1 Tax=unclassified Nitrobacter TaxID=2620411 RepID=UPI000926B425|nr:MULTISPECIES: HlyD family type I secretion periplasmic adaptor subunit [unclassified Nitrobacter]MBN9148398.1 HlyD family type I secretion periplasmic adaptor subunit [Nitrobacter sp.]OJV00796.1 MAG: hemolysin secretion protein D [Nitrobacter sp. 62-23]
MAQFGPKLRRSLLTHTIAVAVVGILLLGGVGGWAASTEFAGAVIAPGQVVVESNVRKVQHPSGGVVGQLLVHDGSRVELGDVLIRLDETQTRANLSIIVKALDELEARQAREEAERDASPGIQFPKSLLDQMSDPDVAKSVHGEQEQFKIRGQARDGQKLQLRERIAQLGEEANGYEAQVLSKANQIEWIAKELVGVNDLWEKNLVPYSRVTALEREKERLEGERGQLRASIAQTKGKTAEIQLQILQVDQDMRAEVGKDLAELRAKQAELVEKRVAAEDQLRRIDLRAPQSGVVYQLAVHTVGGVIGPGEVTMLIVPDNDSLDVEVRIQPQDIDQIQIGHRAVLRFSAFNQRTTPELNGSVSRIAPDVTEDPKTGVHYYTVRINIPKDELTRLGDLKLVPGMPVESFMQTAPRTVMSYLLRPFHDQLARAFREK